MVIFTLFYSLLDLRSSECDVISLYVVCCSVNVPVCCLGVVAILLLNVMDVFSVCGGALLDKPCMVFQRVCVCCACDPNERLSAPSICLCFCMSEVISSFRSLRAGSQVFALLMLFLWVILHTMSSVKSLQLLCILPFGMLCLSAISMMFVNILLAVCMLVGMVV